MQVGASTFFWPCVFYFFRNAYPMLMFELLFRLVGFVAVILVGSNFYYLFQCVLLVTLTLFLSSGWIYFLIGFYFFHRYEAIRYDRAYCSYRNLATLKSREHVDNFLILCVCRYLFKQAHSSVSRKHFFFFSYIGVCCITSFFSYFVAIFM